MNEWTQKDITRLAQGFYEGQSLKNLSSSLNRTPSALNKALTRFGIRQKKPKKTSQNGDNKGKKFDLDMAFTAKKQNKISMRTSLQENAKKHKVPFNKAVQSLYQEHLQAKKDHKIQWITLSEVVQFLLKKGHVIFVESKSQNNGEIYYYCEGKHLRPYELVIKMNQYRCEEKKQTLYVKEITW